MKYFHELTDKEIEELVSNKTTVGFVRKNFKKPDWCNDNDALSFELGCWSLCDLSKNGKRKNISKDFCETCEYFKKC